VSAASLQIPAGELRHEEPMSRHTSWRVGGPAEIYFRPESRADLCAFLAQLDPDTPVHWVGLGSNLLVRDGGLRGVVLNTSRALGKLRQTDDTGGVEVEAGVACTQLARRCARWGLGPAAFFAGIPGTVGGALRMNAGAFGGETWDRVIEVDTVDHSGRVHCRDRSAFDVAYREVRGPVGEWYLAARFGFDADSGDQKEDLRALLQERQQRQPLGLPSCGSVFRNPPGDHAARLIEAAGLKGRRRGAAQVSEKHANFIINTGGASAADVEDLIEEVRDTVQARHGVRLELEVHVLGERERSAT
jgi:UDP-N-acetylmuramate dehydrogenase